MRPQLRKILCNQLLQNEVLEMILIDLRNVHAFEVLGFDVFVEELEGLFFIVFEDVEEEDAEVVQSLAVSHVWDGFVTDCV